MSFKTAGITALFLSIGSLASAHEENNNITSMTCGPETSPMIANALNHIRENFKASVSSSSDDGSRTFEVFTNNDETSPAHETIDQHTIVVARYPNGTVCYTPTIQ